MNPVQIIQQRRDKATGVFADFSYNKCLKYILCHKCDLEMLEEVIGVDSLLNFRSLLWHLFSFSGPKLQFKHFWDFKKFIFFQKSWKERLLQRPNSPFRHAALARPTLPPCSAEIHPALITAPLIHPSLHSYCYIKYCYGSIQILLWQHNEITVAFWLS